jgi:hypothetical protein
MGILIQGKVLMNVDGLDPNFVVLHRGDSDHCSACLAVLCESVGVRPQTLIRKCSL